MKWGVLKTILLGVSNRPGGTPRSPGRPPPRVQCVKAPSLQRLLSAKESLPRLLPDFLGNSCCQPPRCRAKHCPGPTLLGEAPPAAQQPIKRGHAGLCFKSHLNLIYCYLHVFCLKRHVGPSLCLGWVLGSGSGQRLSPHMCPGPGSTTWSGQKRGDRLFTRGSPGHRILALCREQVADRTSHHRSCRVAVKGRANIRGQRTVNPINSVSQGAGTSGGSRLRPYHLQGTGSKD